MTMAAERSHDTELPEVTTRTEDRGRTTVLFVAGEIDMITTPEFQQALVHALAERRDALAVDLSEVGFFASAGLSTLVSAYEMADSGVPIHVVASEMAVHPLRITALDRRMPLHDSVEDVVGRCALVRERQPLRCVRTASGPPSPPRPSAETQPESTRTTCTASGPCMPRTCTISMSPELLGPVISCIPEGTGRTAASRSIASA